MFDAFLLMIAVISPSVQQDVKGVVILDDKYWDGRENKNHWARLPAEWIPAIHSVVKIFSERANIDCFDLQVTAGVVGSVSGVIDRNLVSVAFHLKEKYRRREDVGGDSFTMRSACGLSHTYILGRDKTIIWDYGNK